MFWCVCCCRGHQMQELRRQNVSTFSSLGCFCFIILEMLWQVWAAGRWLHQLLPQSHGAVICAKDLYLRKNINLCCSVTSKTICCSFNLRNSTCQDIMTVLHTWIKKIGCLLPHSCEWANRVLFTWPHYSTRTDTTLQLSQIIPNKKRYSKNSLLGTEITWFLRAGGFLLYMLSSDLDIFLSRSGNQEFPQDPKQRWILHHT